MLIMFKIIDYNLIFYFNWMYYFKILLHNRPWPIYHHLPARPPVFASPVAVEAPFLLEIFVN